MNSSSCDRCGKLTPHYSCTNYTTDGETLVLCGQCLNADVAERVGLDEFDNRTLDPISITGIDGVIHQFHFHTRLLGDIVTLEAFELKEGEPSGYQFQLIGAPEEDRFTQLGRLVKRIRSNLAIKYLEDTGHGLQFKNVEVKGKIESNMSGESDLYGPTRQPVLVIDGQEVPWEQFGEMLMTFEGFQFKLQIIDKSRDLEG
jgi:hypothetical protein